MTYKQKELLICYKTQADGLQDKLQVKAINCREKRTFKVKHQMTKKEMTMTLQKPGTTTVFWPYIIKCFEIKPTVISVLCCHL